MEWKLEKVSTIERRDLIVAASLAYDCVFELFVVFALHVVRDGVHVYR